MREPQRDDHTICPTERNYGERRDGYYSVATAAASLAAVFTAGFLVTRWGLVTEPLMLAGAFLLGVVAPVLVLDLTHDQQLIGWIRENFSIIDQWPATASFTNKAEEWIEPEVELIESDAAPARLTGMPDPFPSNRLLH